MRSARVLAVTGLASLAAIVGTFALPLSQAAHAASPEAIKAPQKVMALQQKGNEAVDVDTQLDCSTHTLTAQVTNKTDTMITPAVTFNDLPAEAPSTLTVKPGETVNYPHSFTGDDQVVYLEVNVDTFKPVKMEPLVQCTEPVGFRATDSSNTAVVGELRNNSTLVPQVVYTQVASGDVRVETLKPGESRVIAMPFDGFDGQTRAVVTIATAAGYETSYSVSLEGAEIPYPPAPIPLGQ